VAIGRRPSIDLPVLAAGPAGDRAVADGELSPLDVPAFLRRQSEA
jgi:hypothetical protein